MSDSTQLAIAHVSLLNGNMAKAIEVLEEMSAYEQAPGMVATLVAMYKASGKAEVARAILDRAVSHYAKGGEANFSGYTILREAANEKLRSGQVPSFEALLKRPTIMP